MSGYFSDLPIEPPNPVLGLAAECLRDPSPHKINLTVGAYRGDNGLPFVLPSVQQAEVRIAQLPVYQHHEYLPQDGLPEFLDVARDFLFGPALAIAEQRVYSIQTVAGTGALRLGAEFLKLASDRLHCQCPTAAPSTATIAIPNVTWQNHPVIFNDAGLHVVPYRYLSASGVSFDFDAMLSDLQALSPGTILLLHACAHNPTGCDPSDEQWRAILQVVQARGLLPFFDNAYQGFVSGDPDIDAFAVRLFAAAHSSPASSSPSSTLSPLPMAVACSFSKNFGLYGERVGALHVVCPSAVEVPRVAAIVRALARPFWSTCSAHGARLVAVALREFRAQWVVDCQGMALRVQGVRQALVDKLEAKRVRGRWDHVVTQRGMFSYSGIDAESVDRLKTEFHIYLLRDGRMSISSLNSQNMDRFVEALLSVLGTN
jgi:aspartate/tyrosine/aromatic aminotransferase